MACHGKNIISSDQINLPVRKRPSMKFILVSQTNRIYISEW